MKRLILLELILLFLATTFRSDSTGGWVQQILPVNDQINDIYFTDSLTGWVVTNSNLSTSDTGYIFKTTDSGNNWITQYKGIVRFNVVQFINPNTGYAGAENPIAVIFKTTNGGSNWNVVDSLLIGLMDMFFVNANTGWICDDNPLSGGILKTTNGGLNWQQQVGASFSIKKLFMLNKDTGWAGSNEANGKLYRTTNGGGNWNLQYTFNGSLYNVLFNSSDTGFVVGGGGSASIKKTTDGGFTWNNTIGSIGGRGLFFVNSDIGWDCDLFSTMQKTTDKGITWFNQTVPSGDYNSIRFTDTSKGWAGGTILIHTTDGGGPPLGIHPVGGEIPSDFKLFQNYPNPFNPITVISYQLRVSSYVKMTVYDIMGKEIAVLVNQKQNPGTYRVDFNGSGYSSGVYFYQLTVENKIVDTKKMVMIK